MITSLEDLVEELKLIKRNYVLGSDQDYVIAITGGEGSGKSMLALYLAIQLDEDFNCDKICFTGEEYFDMQKKLHDEKKEKGSVLVLDEGGAILFKRKAMEKLTVKIVENFILCRSANMIHIICSPSFSIIDKYLREVRVGMVIHCKYLTEDYFITNRYVRVVLKPTLDKWFFILKNYSFIDNDITFGKRTLTTCDAEFFLPKIPDMIDKKILGEYYKKKNKRRKTNLKEIIEKLNTIEKNGKNNS